MGRATLVAVLAIALSGCGEERSSWAKAVEGLCNELADKAEDRALELREEAGGDTESQEEFVARVLETTAELSRPYLERMAAVTPPEGKEREVARFFALLRRTYPLLEEAARAVREGDRATIERANAEILKIAEASRKAARDLDVDECVPSSGR